MCLIARPDQDLLIPWSMSPATADIAPYLNEPLDPEDFEIAVQVLQMVHEGSFRPSAPSTEPELRPFPAPFDKDAA